MISTFAIQFAKVGGAKVISTTSTKTKEELLLELGATETVYYKDSPEWQIKVSELAFDMTPRLESINAAHPEHVSLHTGPLVLFPILPAAESLKDSELLEVRRVSESRWVAQSSAGTTILKPFMYISNENYRLYTKLTTHEAV